MNRKALLPLLLLFATAPAGAATLSPAEETHCLAVGQTLTRLGKAEADVATLLKDKLGTTASAKDKATVAQYQAVADSTLALGQSLEITFALAAPPSADDLKALEATGMDALTAEAQTCTR
jgi:hypothetical protein